MLDASALQQVKSYLDRLVNPITLTFAGDASEASEQIRSLLSDLASVSKLITVADAPADLQVRRPSFTISRTGENMGIRFAALPMAVARILVPDSCAAASKWLSEQVGS